jgi:hypothetical protein
MRITDYLQIIFDVLIARGLVSSSSEFSTVFIGSSSRSYFSTCCAREAIGIGSLLRLSKKLKASGQDDLSRLVDQIIRG